MSEIKERRRRGEGSLEVLPSGRIRVRMPGDRHPLGTFDDPEEAKRVLNAARELVADRKLLPTKGRSLRDLGDAYVTRKVRRGVRGVGAHESRLAHILQSRFADWPVDELSVLDVDAWLDDLSRRQVPRGAGMKTISKHYVRQVLGTLVAVLDDAQIRGLVAQNVARLVELPLDDDDEDNEPWTYLILAEQELLFSRAFETRNDWLLARVALGTGIRAGELATLGLEDVHLEQGAPYIRIRWGSVKNGKRRSTKSRKARNVPLFGIALEAMREWLELLPRACPNNPHRLVFPRPRGGFRDAHHMLGRRRRAGKNLDLWQLAIARSSIGRNVRWHDLRHTCASSLIAGWWGKRWLPGDVQKLLGHSSLRTTERYAHLAESVLQELALATTGPVQTSALPAALLPTAFPRGVNSPENKGVCVSAGRGCSRVPPVDSPTYVPSWADCGPSAVSEARIIVAGLASGEHPSAESVQALCDSVVEAVRSSHPLLRAVDRVDAGGRYLVPALLELCSLVLPPAEGASVEAETAA